MHKSSIAFLIHSPSYRQLSGSALAALQDFYKERDVQQKRFEDLKTASESNVKLSMDMFSVLFSSYILVFLCLTMLKEDWNASQFWVGGLTECYGCN